MNTTNTIKKSYELKAEHNKKVLNAFLANSTADFKRLVNSLLVFCNINPDRATGSITVSIGNKITDNCFNSLLMSHTNKPVVVIGAWDDEPRLLIGVDNQQINHMICAFNLTLIDKLSVDKKGDNKYMIDFRYDNSVDYQLDITYNAK